MKKLLSILLLSLALFSFAMPSPALADGDPSKGASVFAANCNACHLGGRNVIMSMKTLKKDALAKYLKGFSEDAQAAITYQVTNGKGAMPAFKGRLNAEQIENVSAYVVAQAEKGW
ncbi:MAG: c-type cytochrome [Microcoleaceae cyanobacterium]